MPYLPRSHPRLPGYISEEDHVAKSKLAKIPNINIESIMNELTGLNGIFVCLLQCPGANFNFGNMYPKS